MITKTAKRPKHLRKCTSCDTARPSWEHIGWQSFPAHYAKLTGFAAKLANGTYAWDKKRESFGFDLYNCPMCGTTANDVKVQES